MQESTKEAPASEYVMVERMFVGEEKQLLERLKEEARMAKELQLTPVLPVKSERDISPSDSTDVTQQPLVNGKKEPCDDYLSTAASTPTPRMTPKVIWMPATLNNAHKLLINITNLISFFIQHNKLIKFHLARNFCRL